MHTTRMFLIHITRMCSVFLVSKYIVYTHITQYSCTVCIYTHIYNMFLTYRNITFVLCLFGVQTLCIHTLYKMLVDTHTHKTNGTHVNNTYVLCLKQHVCVVSLDDNAMQHRFVAVVPRSTLAKRRFFQRRLNSKGGGWLLVWREVAFFIIRFVTWWGLSCTWQVFF